MMHRETHLMRQWLNLRVGEGSLGSEPRTNLFWERITVVMKIVGHGKWQARMARSNLNFVRSNNESSLES